MREIIVAIILIGAFCSYSYGQIQTNGLKNNNKYDVMKHQEKAMNTLLGWGGISVFSGSLMLFNESTTIRDFGIQNIAWGVIDSGIALYARRSISNKRKLGFSIQEEKQKFRKLLLINSLLDIVYVGVGITMAASGMDKLKGHGYGIIVQGVFLLLFDGINYFLIPEQ